jgi:hypothetical protein
MQCTLTLVRTALHAYSCGVCMSSVTSCVSGGLFICFTCLHVPYNTATLITCSTNTVQYRQGQRLLTAGI